MNLLYAKKLALTILFGRGHMGGTTLLGAAQSRRGAMQAIGNNEFQNATVQLLLSV